VTHDADALSDRAGEPHAQENASFSCAVVISAGVFPVQRHPKDGAAARARISGKITPDTCAVNGAAYNHK